MPSLDFEAEKAGFRDYYDDNAPRLDQAREAFLTLLGSLLAHGDLAVAAATGRIKDREESIKKFTRKYQGALEESATPYEIKDHITDLIGLRLVCLYEDEIEPMGEFVRRHFNVIEVSDKTAEIEGTENAFGYKGASPRHDARRGARGDARISALRALSLRAPDPHDHPGFVEHARPQDKVQEVDPESLKRRINTLAALFELADREFRQVRDETELQIEKASAEPEPEVQEPAAGPTREADEIVRRQYAPLDAFRLLRIAGHYFPKVEFEPKKVDGFTAEVIERAPKISRDTFNGYLRSQLPTVRRYKADFLASGRGDKFNAFTEMRHALYAANPEAFAGMLTNVARDSFDAWLAGDGNEQA
jgi:putative GTP pyrophosphokinase